MPHCERHLVKLHILYTENSVAQHITKAFTLTLTDRCAEIVWAFPQFTQCVTSKGNTVSGVAPRGDSLHCDDYSA